MFSCKSDSYGYIFIAGWGTVLLPWCPGTVRGRLGLIWALIPSPLPGDPPSLTSCNDPWLGRLPPTWHKEGLSVGVSHPNITSFWTQTHRCGCKVRKLAFSDKFWSRAAKKHRFPHLRLHLTCMTKQTYVTAKIIPLRCLAETKHKLMNNSWRRN